MKFILILLSLIIVPKESHGFGWLSYYKSQILNNQRTGLVIATEGVNAQYAQARATQALAAAQQRHNDIELQIHHDKQGREDAKVADNFIFEKIRKVQFSKDEFDKWLKEMNTTVGRFRFDEKDKVAFILGMRKDESDAVNTMIWLKSFCALVDDYKPINYDINEICLRFTINTVSVQKFFGQTYQWLMDSEKDAVTEARENAIRDLKDKIETEAKGRWPEFKELADAMNSLKEQQAKIVDQFISDIPTELDGVEFDEWMKEIDEIEPQLVDNDVEKNVKLFVGMRKNSKLVVNNIWLNGICRNKDEFNSHLFSHVKNFCDKFSKVDHYQFFNIRFHDLIAKLRVETRPSCDKMQKIVSQKISKKAFELTMERIKDVKFSIDENKKMDEFNQWMKNIDDGSKIFPSLKYHYSCQDKLIEMHEGPTSLESKFIWINTLCSLRIDDGYTINKHLLSVCYQLDARPAQPEEYLGAGFSYDQAGKNDLKETYKNVIIEATKKLKDEILKVKDKWPAPPFLTRIGKIFHKK